jgi:hypothetical protein
MFGRARISNNEVTTGSETTISFTNDGTSDYISDSASNFVSDGFIAGQTINVSTNSGTNDGQYTISAVAAGKLTLSASDSLSDEDASTAGATTITSYNDNLLKITGDNNTFINLHIANYGSDTYAAGSVEITGNRNAFIGCHIVGAGNATPAATTSARDIKLNSAEEVYFKGCVFGTDSVIRAAANGNISYDGGCWRTVFEDCIILSYSATAGKGAIISADNGSISGVHSFRRCSFINWNPNGISASTAAFIGTDPTSGEFLMDSCSLLGWSAWTADSGTVYVANSDATASGAGGIATTV